MEPEPRPLKSDQSPVRELIEFRQPSVAAVSGLTISSCEPSVDDSKVTNEFARLLNRGSSLE
jgi:hypothetical protein